MKQLVLSTEQMKHIEELGLDTSDASMYWVFNSQDWELKFKKPVYKASIPAYTLQDVLEKLTSFDRQSVILHEPGEWLDVAYDLLCFELTHKE